MKTQDISKLSGEELGRKLDEMKKQMVSLKLTHKMAPIENPMRIRGLRKTIARLSTEFLKRQNAA
ncbi:MAG: 50S ribosomal protein L29 [Flavobacteriia bacterium]|jgi:large subunit ribosomal protein L29|nr:50S ribosomal protein L29 [Flavobacteriia bacterium]NBV66972.1 50S ribosomal protein L29 [Flavobacteriia bacterium]NBV90858.1 50S ribosomal protein L29 [Flavobacteriia bacterium]NBY41015.1 50S ribosomal protein L29 [Flavobacteriia bacterium]